MRLDKKEIFIRFLLTVLFSGTGFLFVNFFLIKYISTKDQITGFPRNLLNYIPRPINSWNYPDLNSSSNNKFILIGDSHGEGAGDAFLKGSYDYSAGHYITKNKEIGILLASNSGTSLPIQLFFLEEAIKGKYGPNKIYKYFQKDKYKKNIISFFYEGNDLEEQFLFYDRYIEESKKPISKIKRVLNKYFPLIYLTRATIIRGKFLNKVGSINKNINTTFNKICINQVCRLFPPMQSAAPELTQKQINKSINQTTESIINFKNKYKSKICFIYIPSPATIYSPAIIKSQKLLKANEYDTISSEMNNYRSEYIRNRFSMALNTEGIKYIDSTDYLKEFAANNFIHGEIDPNHFNAKGYEHLGDFVLLNKEKCFLQKK